MSLSVSTDLSLPLEDDSLCMPPPLPGRQVRFYPERSQGAPTPPAASSVVEYEMEEGELSEIQEGELSEVQEGELSEIQEHESEQEHDQDQEQEQGMFASQVDGSSDSLQFGGDKSSFQAQFTMRECEDQITCLKKENFNLKLRIYFMEQSQGWLHAPKEQENLYKVNIDLKVHGEELKKDLEEQRTLLSDAARALQSQEDKYESRISALTLKLKSESEKREEAEQMAARAKLEMEEARKNERVDVVGEHSLMSKISDESKLLYTEAFGSINLGKEADLTAEEEKDSGKGSDEEWNIREAHLTDIISDKNKQIHDLETQVTELGRNMEEADGYNSDLVETSKKQAADLASKEYIITDCKAYINSLTEQLDAKTVEVEELQEKLLNNSQLQDRDEEIAGLQAEVALHQGQEERVAQLELELKTLKDKNVKSDSSDRQNMHASEQEIIVERQKVKELEQRLMEHEGEGKLQQEVVAGQRELAETLKNELESQRQKVQEQQVEMDGLSGSIDALQEQLVRQEETLKEQQQEIEIKKNVIEEQQQRIDQQKMDVRQLEQELANHGDCQLLKDQLLAKDSEIDELALKHRRENEVMGAQIQNYNDQIAELKMDLEKRNGQVIGFVQKVKDIKEALRSQRGPSGLGNLSFCSTVERQSPDLDWDYEEIFEESGELLHCLVGGDWDKENVFESKVKELEHDLSEKENTIEELRQKLKTVNTEQIELTHRMNGKTDRIDELSGELDRVRGEMEKGEQRLHRSLTAIQGLAQETHKLKEQLARSEEKRRQLGSEVERLGREAAKGEREQGRLLVRKAVDKAREVFAVRLAEYRRRFDQLLKAWKAGRSACELMRCRLEELADFLQRLLDSQGLDVSLNASRLSMDLRENLQRSIDESRILSNSVLLEQTSLLEDMDIGGLGEEEDVQQEEWTVPSVSVSSLLEGDITEESGQVGFVAEHQETVVKELERVTKIREYTESRLREAEQKLETMQKLFVSADLNQLKVSKTRRRARSTGGVETRKKNGAQGKDGRKTKSLPETDSDSWSEPDKAESRARMGLQSGYSVGGGDGGARTTEDEMGLVGGFLTVELNRERNTVESLKQQLVEVKSRLGDGEAVMNCMKEELGRSHSKCHQLNQQLTHVEMQLKDSRQKAEENDRELCEARLEMTGLMDDNKKYEELYDKLNDEYQLIVEEVEKWKKLAKDKKKSEDLSNLMAKIEIREGEMSKAKVEFSKKKAEVNELKEINRNLEERCEHLENIIDQNDSKIAELTRKIAQFVNMSEINRNLEERCEHLEDILQQNDAKLFEHDENIRILSFEVEKRDKNIAMTNSELLTTKNLLIELSESNKDIKSQLAHSKTQLLQSNNDLIKVNNAFADYKKSYNEEIIQNRVNEVETKMRAQAEGVKKFADELIKIEKKFKKVDAEKQQLEIECHKYKEEIESASISLREECYKAEELTKTVENLRIHVEKLEAERLVKQSLEVELERVKKRHMEEKEVKDVLVKRVDELEKRLASGEKIRPSVEKVFFNESGKENMNTSNHNLSKREFESALGSCRRRGLTVIDHNREEFVTTTSSKTSSICSCGLKDELDLVRQQRDQALSKLQNTKDTLASTAEKLSTSDRRKKEVEKAICRQLSKTHDVLRKTKKNLENQCAGEN